MYMYIYIYTYTSCTTVLVCQCSRMLCRLLLHHSSMLFCLFVACRWDLHSLIITAAIKLAPIVSCIVQSFWLIHSNRQHCDCCIDGDMSSLTLSLFPYLLLNFVRVTSTPFSRFRSSLQFSAIVPSSLQDLKLGWDVRLQGNYNRYLRFIPLPLQLWAASFWSNIIGFL